jgi:hypothetical protein
MSRKSVLHSPYKGCYKVFTKGLKKTSAPLRAGAWHFSLAAGNIWRRATPGIATLFFAPDLPMHSSIPHFVPSTQEKECAWEKKEKERERETGREREEGRERRGRRARQRGLACTWLLN